MTGSAHVIRGDVLSLPLPDASSDCDGDGGVVYWYEGPQFGAHLIEEPCDQCGKWHPRRQTDGDAQ